MNDIVLRKAVLKRELLIFTIALGVAFCINIYAIMIYDTAWSEVITSLGFVVIFALLFYVLTLVFRVLSKGIASAIKLMR